MSDSHIVTGRDIAALLNPRPVVLVTAGTLEAPEVASIAWVTPLSHAPALLGIAIRATSVTYQRLIETGEFTVNVMGEGFGDAIDACGASHGNGAAKLAKAGLCAEAGSAVAAPHIAEALSWLECKIASTAEAGDHMFVTGEVLEAHTTCARDERGLMVSPDTLLCLQHGAYGIMAD